MVKSIALIRSAVSALWASMVFAAAAGVGEEATDLTEEDWASIRELWEESCHDFREDGKCGYRAFNPGQGWNIEFDGRGFLVKPSGDDWRWGMALASLGRDRSGSFLLGERARVSLNGGKLTYQWAGDVEEWFVNDERGLKQGWTIGRRSGGEGPLRLHLKLRGGTGTDIDG
jgi:trimeric autotransporter adhesin